LRFTDFNNEQSVKEGVVKIVEIISAKPVSFNDSMQSLRAKSKLIGNENYNGTITKETKDKAVIEKGGYRVIVKKEIRDNSGNVIQLKNWVVTAYDNVRGINEKKASVNTLTTPIDNEGSRAVTPDANSKMNTSSVSTLDSKKTTETVNLNTTQSNEASISTDKGKKDNPDKQKKDRIKSKTSHQKRLDTLKEFSDSSIRGKILHGIASGKFKFVWKDDGVKRGLASEFGYEGKETERRKRINLLSNKGYTPDQLAHYLWQNENPWGLEDTDIKNEILDVLRSVGSKKQALEELEGSKGIS